jgi:ribosomal protein L6P/L9E
VGAIGLEFFYRNKFHGLFYTFFKRVFFQFTQIFFKKIKFKGKGYYSYKNYRNSFAMQFGYSHIVRRYFYFINAKFLAKTSIFLFGVNQLNIFKAAYLFFFVKPLNIFTSRGIRFTRQIVYKKVGKISSYR